MSECLAYMTLLVRFRSGDVVRGVLCVVWSGVMQDGINPLLDACSRGDTAIVKVLLSSSEVNTNIVGRVSWR